MCGEIKEAPEKILYKAVVKSPFLSNAVCNSAYDQQNECTGE